jgi:formylglycine-generating enzyme required for sulfatase activity
VADAFLSATRHEHPCDWALTQFARPDLPVVGVSWIDAAAYCAWRSERDGRQVRLPTEAEWEFAARGRRQALFPWGDAVPEWIPNGGRGPLPGPWPVTLGEPTDFGLFGIAANVHEWCADWYDADYYGRSPERNPAGPDRGVRRAARGGSWRHARTLSRVTQRSRLDPSFRYNDFGFRLARNPSP